MLDKNGKYKFYQKDEWSSMFYRRALMKRNREFLSFRNNEIKLRNRSTKDKIKSNDYFSFNNIYFCLINCKKNCKYEDYKKRKMPTPIEGLNCDQIDDYLYASQRLTNQLIKKYDLIKKFKELNIGLIVNCEEEGEHPYCGTAYHDGLDKNGFSYSTVELEKNGITVLSCGWTDFIPPDSFYHMIKIVKKMYYFTHSLKKKILVHCHAGIGRTATALACYKMFSQKLNSIEARQEVRKGARKMCLSGGKLFTYIQEFGKYLEISRENFFKKNKKDIIIFKINEKILDVGNYKFCYFNDKKYIDNVPLFLLYIFDRIIQLKNKNKIDDKTMNILLSDKVIKKEEENIIERIKKEINKYNWESINKIEDIKILGKLLFAWLNNSINYVINPKDISFNSTKDGNSYILEKNKSPTKEIINCITIFLNLIKSNKDDKNENFKEFLEIFIPFLLGYSLEEINDKNKQENIDKLKKILSY